MGRGATDRATEMRLLDSIALQLRKRRKLVRVYLALFVIGYPFLVAYVLRRRPAADVSEVVVYAIFFLFYLVPLGLFQAHVVVTDQGLAVTRWNTTVIEYPDILRCFSFCLLPFRVVLIIARRRFPLSIIVTGEEHQDQFRVLFREGPLAASIKARMKAARG